MSCAKSYQQSHCSRDGTIRAGPSQPAIIVQARTIKAAQPPKPEPVADATNATDETTAAAPAAAEAAAAVKTESADNDEAPPGVEGGDDAMEAVNTEAKAAAVIEVSDAEAKEQWLAEVAAVTKSAAAARDLRAPYEKRIRRFWWHYKPLDATQLLTWWQYLDFLGAQGDSVTPLQMRGLYERCLVACGSYPGTLPDCFTPRWPPIACSRFPGCTRLLLALVFRSVRAAPGIRLL